MNAPDSAESLVEIFEATPGVMQDLHYPTLSSTIRGECCMQWGLTGILLATIHVCAALHRNWHKLPMAVKSRCVETMSSPNDRSVSPFKRRNFRADTSP